MRSTRGRSAWQRHIRVTASFEDTFAADPRADISAGAWRRRVFGPRVEHWPAVQPQHERRKYLHLGADLNRVSRFAGLGRHGRAKLRRAELLGDAGFVSAPLDLTNGFLTQEWIDGTPLAASDAATKAVLDRLASYLVLFVVPSRPAAVRRLPTSSR